MNRFLKLMCFVSFTILITASSFAQFAPISIERLNNDDGAAPQTGANILFTSQDNVVVVWADRRFLDSDYDIFLRSSSDGGMTFSNEIKVNDLDGYVRANEQQKICIEQNIQGDLVFNWADARNGFSNVDIYGRIRYINGDFSEAIRLNDDQTETFQGLSRLSRIPQSNIMLATWLDYRGCPPCPEVSVTRSVDGGLSWSANIRADIQGEDAIPCECCRPWIAGGNNDRVLVAFRNNISDIRDIYVARANDDFTEFSPPVRASFGDWEIQGCPFTGPVLLQHSTGVWIAASADGRNAPYRIYTSRSIDDGISFQDETIVDDTGLGQNYLFLLELPDNRLLIAFQEGIPDNGGTTIMGAISEDVGLSWGAPFEISDSEESFKSNVRLAHNNLEMLFAIWVDERRGNKDIYFAALTETASCDYIPGDVDHNGVPLQLDDLISMISIYRGMTTPYYACDCPPHNSSFAAEGDPNGNCLAFELGDVVQMIAAYRGTAGPSACPDCPGSP